MMLVPNQLEDSQSIGLESFKIQPETSISCEIQLLICKGRQWTRLGEF